MTNPDLVVVFNCTEIGGGNNVDTWIKNVRSLTSQKDIKFEFVLSACQVSNASIEKLRQEFGTSINYFITQQLLTVNCSFNRACELAEREYGMPRGFLYVDSGCSCGDDTLAVKRLYDNHRLGNWAMSAGLVDKDSGFDLWRPGMTEDQLFIGDLYEVPAGSTVNLHFQIFDRSLVKAFGHPIPDIFRDFCTESVFSFMCSAVTRSFAVWRNVRIAHAHGLDGGASGFQGDRGWRSLLPEAPRKMEDIIADPEALDCGFGYEECEQILMHNPKLYTNPGGMVKQELRLRLRKFIKENLFIPKERFDYDKIVATWIPRGKDMESATLPDEPKYPDLDKLENRAGLRAWLDSVGLTGESIHVTTQTPAMAQGFKNQSMDCVLIDGNKDYAAVLGNLDAWWPKTKRGGLMAGLDFSNKSSYPNFDDKRHAITRWMEEKRIQYRVLPDGMWCAVKRW